MKRLIIAIILIVSISTANSQQRIGSSFRTQSYYGFSGLMFIPTAQSASPGEWGFSYTSEPAIGEELTLIPFSFRFLYSPNIRG